MSNAKCMEVPFFEKNKRILSEYSTEKMCWQKLTILFCFKVSDSKVLIVLRLVRIRNNKNTEIQNPKPQIHFG